MAYSPSEKYPGAVDSDPNYKGGKFRDNNPSTTNNGSPLKAIDRNELLARDEAIMNDAGFDYNGLPDTPQDSQLFKAYKASLGNGANLLSNHNFLIPSPDDSQPAPSSTPTSYPPGFQIFSGVFANETTGITNLTYIDGRVSFSGGDLYFAVPNTGGLERLNADQFVASVADFDGKPRTRGVSFALVGDEYRVTVGVDALSDGVDDTLLGSVKFEQGKVATGHDVQSIKGQGYTFNGVYEMVVIGAPLGSTASTGATQWKIIPPNSTKGITLNSGLKAIALNGLWIDDFGCIADGTRDSSPNATGKRNISGTDNSEAYKSVVDAWLDGASKTIIAGSGQYNFVDSGILSYSNGKTQNGGYTLKGQGGKNQATYFMMTTEGGGKWFYDNGDGNSIYQFNKYEGICFGSSNPANANFMKMWSNGYEQGFTYTDVQVEYVREVTRTEGNANASEVKWYNSKFFYTTSSILTLNNTQSINHEFYGCDAEVILGNIVALDNLGGGSVKWFGGSIIMDGTIPAYIVKNFAGGGGVGTNNQDFTFTGIKTELKDNVKGVVDADNPAGNSITVKFLNSNLTVVEGTTPREAVSLKAGHTVRFDNCEMPQEFQYTISGNNEAQDNNGLLEFENCKDFKDLPSRISISNFFGSARARECTFVDTAGSGDSPQYATDFDVNPTNNGRGTYSSIKKSASLMQNRVGWPYSSINEQSLVVPDNSVITKITVYRPASGGSSSSYTLKVGNNDKTTAYGSSTTTQQKFDHSFVVDNLNLNVGTDANKKRVRLWADGGDTAIGGAGFVIVEYI